MLKRKKNQDKYDEEKIQQCLIMLNKGYVYRERFILSLERNNNKLNK